VILIFEGKSPQISENVFVAADAMVLGDVGVGSASSIWYGAVLRGDVHWIRVGQQTNIQDRCGVHVTTGVHPTEIGDRVTIGHGAVVHGCRVGDECLIGIGAILLDGVEVGEGSLVAAGSLLPPGRSYPSDSLIAGAPAEVKRPLKAGERDWIVRSAQHYVALAARHASLLASQNL
jgi:carbonic anhydrase/acetyltransferase-like protein (isoleucine patch superfamily)